MAELLGAVASGIAVAQLAGTIVGSTQKIYYFYSEMKDAPKKLGDLFVEIELLGEVLVDFYDQNTQTTGQSKIVPKVLKHCRTVMENLDKILNVLKNCLNKDGGMIKRQWRTLKVVLKEKTLEELTERLERAKSLLTLAVNCHSLHLNKAMQKTLIQLSTSGMSTYTTQTNKAVAIPENNSVQVSKKESTSSIRGTANSYGFFSYWSTTSVFNQQNKKKHLRTSNTGVVDINEDADMDVDLTILPKAWMRLKGMHIKQSRRFGRWTYYFRPVRVVPDESPIFYACKNGDIGEILQLLQTGRASVFDTSQKGYNLIHFAALNLRADLCRWLLTQGVQATETESVLGQTALHVASSHVNRNRRSSRAPFSTGIQCYENRGRHNDAFETIRVLIEVGQCDPMQESKFGETSLHWYYGKVESFNYMLNQESVLIHPDLQDTIESILKSHTLIETSFVDTIIKFMMDKSTKFSEYRRLRNGFPSWPQSLHSTLELLSDIICTSRVTCDPTATISLVSALLEMRVDIHKEDRDLGTPLSSLFTSKSYVIEHPSRIIDRTPLKVLTWFKLLRRAGQSLIWYIHVYQARNTADMVCNFEWYDCRDQYSNFKLLHAQKKPKMPGAWEDGNNMRVSADDLDLIYPKVRVSDMRRPSRSPDFEISFLIGSLTEGEQIFDHIKSIRRRELTCDCYSGVNCLHTPKFGRYDIETGELDLCSCLEENGCECKDEDTNDNGSELGSEAESIINSNKHEEPREPKEDGVTEGESESTCEMEYYCLNCDRRYSGPILAN